MTTYARSVTWFAWYLCAVLALLTLMASFITWHPSVSRIGEILPFSFRCGALLAGIAAVVIGRLPSNHWIHHSKPVILVLVAPSVAATVLLVAAG